MTPLPGASMGTSACTALPSSRTRAASLRNNRRAMSAAGSSRNRASRNASAAPSSRSRRTGPRSGGNGVNEAASRPGLICVHCATSRSQPAASSGSRRARSAAVAAVAAASRWITGASSSIHGRQRVAEHARGRAPPQAVPVELESADHRRGLRERIEHAVHVAHVAREQFGAAHGAAGLGLRFQDQHVPPPRRPAGRRRPARVAGPDHRGIDCLGGASASEGHRVSCARRSARAAADIRGCAVPPRRAALVRAAAPTGPTARPRTSRFVPRAPRR